MPCYRPLTAYRSLSEGGKIVFAKPAPFAPELKLPCGKCVGCTLDRSRSWALRCVHEASQHDQNCVITLTFASEHLNSKASLDVNDLQKFFKRFRKFIAPRRIRYFACGEYGTQFGRPHFHACIFGYDFADKELWSMRDGVRQFVSPSLARLWPFGHCTIGEMDFRSAAYIARYVVKKQGVEPDGSTRRLDSDSGELVEITPEFVVMSRRPGLGRGWYEKYSSDLFPDDFVVHEGQTYKVPRYYGQQLEAVSPELFESIRDRRLKRAELRAWDNTPERLKVREKIALSKNTLLKRTIE